MSKALGAGAWVAKRMEIEGEDKWGEPNESIGVYNEVTGEFKTHENLGWWMDRYVAHMESEGETVDVDYLVGRYWLEAQQWANELNRSHR